MSSDLEELNLAIAEFDWAEPSEPEFRFYYDADTRHGIRLGGTDDGTYVLITREEYEKIGMAFHFYVDKSGRVNPIPLDARGKTMLKLSSTGKFATIKDCIIFADARGPDKYTIRNLCDD